MWDDEEVPVCMECLHDIPGQPGCRCACHLDWEATTIAAAARDAYEAVLAGHGRPAWPPQSFPLAEAFLRVRADPTRLSVFQAEAERIRRELEDGHPGE